MNAQARNMALTALTEASALSLEMCARQAEPMARLKASLRTDSERVLYAALERAIDAHRHFAEGVAQIAAQAVSGGGAS